nr:GntR family transcriptional regulator [Paracoccus aestuariivivens]
MHQVLSRKLCEGEFMPGERVSIRAIATQHELSVIPVRDAIRRLVAEGGLRFADSRTIEVPKLSMANHRDVLFSRIQLEPEAAARAFDNLTQADLKELVRLDGHVNAAIRDGDLTLYMKSNFAFHFLIYRRSGAPTILRLIEILWLQYGPSMRLISGQYGASALADDYHRHATDALSRQDCEGFVRAIRADITQGMEFIRVADH